MRLYSHKLLESRRLQHLQNAPSGVEYKRENQLYYLG